MRCCKHVSVLLVVASFCVIATGIEQVALDQPLSQPSLEPDVSRSFTLRQIHHHGMHKFSSLHRFVDVDPAVQLQISDEHGNILQREGSQYSVKETSMSTPKYAVNTRPTKALPAEPAHWTLAQSRGPNVTDKETVVSFAKMAANAYARKDNSTDWKWQDIGSGFNYTDDFGWENDGLRGHVFADEKNQTIVISIKGTSVPWLDDPDTTMRDLWNDNLFGSCCCAQGGSFWWKPVCDCKTSGNTCNSTCLASALYTRNSYYWAALELYYNVTSMFPGSEVWTTGHSLGGVVSSLLGLTFGLPTLTFEAYPDALAAARFHLPTPPGYNIGDPGLQALHGTHVHHFGHTADPIFMGTCGGAFSYCSFWGYAFEGVCHTGKRCVYDTVKDLNWAKDDVRTHSIVRVIEEVLEAYDDVPSCKQDIDCVDCAKWEFTNGSNKA